MKGAINLELVQMFYNCIRYSYTRFTEDLIMHASMHRTPKCQRASRLKKKKTIKIKKGNVFYIAINDNLPKRPLTERFTDAHVY